MGKICNAQGFSLIEILVAVTIMGLAYVAVLQNFSISAKNIAFMDSTRTAMLVNSLAFDRQLLSMDEMDNDLVGSEDTVAEGSRYRLLQLTDENDHFMILRLEKK